MVTIEESFGVIPLKKEQGHWKVLVILHAKGNHWAFPKGGREAAETPLEAATRELREETGLDIERLLQETPFKEEYQFRKKAVSVSKKVTYYVALVTGQLCVQPQEIRDAKWVSLDEALQILTFDKARAICLKVKDLISHYVV